MSVSTGILVTNAASESNVGGSLLKQMSMQPRALAFAGIALGLLGLLPGMPKLFMWPLAAVLVWIGQKNPGADGGRAT